MQGATKQPGVGDTIGGYHLDEELGRGGFAAVFRATNTVTRAQVALKLLLLTEDPDSQRRFQREAKLLQRLDHRNIVRVLAAGDTGGLQFIATEILAGEDLSQAVGRGVVYRPAEATHILRQLLSALSAAHREGLIHRDIKPANVRICGAPGDPLHVKLLDFGIARDTQSGAPGITRTGVLIGTPRYMAPEQLRSQPVTPATDIYALGLVLAELLFGGGVLHENSWGAQIDRLHDGYQVAEGAIELLDSPLREVLKRMTAVNPEQRYQSVESVLHALDGRATSTAKGGAATPSTQRRAAVVGAFLLAAVAAVALWPNHSPPEVVLGAEPWDGKLHERQVVEDDATDAAVDDVAVDDAGLAATANRTHTPVPSAGCDGGDSEDSEGYDGPAIAETAVYVPEVCVGQPCPVVIAFHDSAVPFLESPRDAAAELLRQITPIADKARFVVAVPVSNVPLGKYELPWSDLVHRTGDFDGLYTSLIRSRCVDRSRVFLLGQVNGVRGMLKEMCRPWVTASAGFGRTFVTNNDLYPCAVPRPMLWLHPRDDLGVPYETGVACTNTGRVMMGYVDMTQWLRRILPTDDTSEKFDLAVEGVIECERWSGETVLSACTTRGGSVWKDATGVRAVTNVVRSCAQRFATDADIPGAMATYFYSVPPLEVDDP